MRDNSWFGVGPSKSGTTRRDFFKTSACALASVPIFGTLASETGTDRSAATSGSAAPESTGSGSQHNYLYKKTRLSIAMWDFSWLMAQYPGGAYEDIERRVAEAAERGYNTLRIDCFPSRILEPQSTFPALDWVPGKNLPKWGEIAKSYTCNVREKVAHLAELCRKEGIWLGLDSWDKAYMFRSAKLPFLETSGAPSGLFGVPSTINIPVGKEEQAFTAYGEIWAQALKLMREDGALERAVWIAPMNEVPHFGSRGVEAVGRIEHQPRNEGETTLEATAELDTLYQRLNHSMGAPIHAEIAKDKIPLSYSSLSAENYAARLTDIYDVVDIHFMPEVILDDDDKRAFEKAGHGAPYGAFQDFEEMDLKAYSAAWDNACRKHYLAMLERASNFFKTALGHTTLASGKKLQAIVTEAYGPCYWPDSSAVSWEWYKRYNADAVRIVAAMDITGATLSNYGEPLFELWADVGWHWTGNNYFRSFPSLVSV